VTDERNPSTQNSAANNRHHTTNHAIRIARLRSTCGGDVHRQYDERFLRASGCIDFGGCNPPGTRSGGCDVNTPLPDRRAEIRWVDGASQTADRHYTSVPLCQIAPIGRFPALFGRAEKGIPNRPAAAKSRRPRRPIRGSDRLSQQVVR
jgi:hypothetical protein